MLLANVLLSARVHLSVPSEKDFLLECATAVIKAWASLPHNNWPITKNYEMGLRMYESALHEVQSLKSCTTQEAEEAMRSYQAQYAEWAVSPASFGRIQKALLNTLSSPVPSVEQTREVLEDSLPQEIGAFLVFVLRKLGEQAYSKTTEPHDKFAKIQSELDVLKTYPLAIQTLQELLGRVEQAHNARDFRQAMGWAAWLFMLANYESKFKLYSSPEELEEFAKINVELLRVTWGGAREARDWDTLLLAAGLCHWTGAVPWRDDLLTVIRVQLSEQEISHRRENMENRPRMALEPLLLRKLRDFLV